LLSNERDEVKDMQSIFACGNYLFIGRERINEDDKKQNSGPLTKAYTQSYSIHYSPLKPEIEYNTSEVKFESVIAIIRDDY